MELGWDRVLLQTACLLLIVILIGINFIHSKLNEIKIKWSKTKGDTEKVDLLNGLIYFGIFPGIYKVVQI